MGPDPVETSAMLRDLLVRVCAGLLSAMMFGTPAPALAEGPAVKDRAEITFTGYQSLPGNRGIVFVELTDAVAVEVSRVGQVIQYRLVGASVPLKNNRNPLLLRDFNTSALSAILVVDAPGKGRRKTKTKTTPAVRLVISLRGAASPSYRMVPRGKGAVLEVELPPVSTP